MTLTIFLMIFQHEASWCKIQCNVLKCQTANPTLSSVPSALSSIRTNFMTIKVSVSPQMNTASWATSVVSMLSSIAMENAINDFISRFNWQSKCTERSEIQSVLSDWYLQKPNAFQGAQSPQPKALHVDHPDFSTMSNHRLPFLQTQQQLIHLLYSPSRFLYLSPWRVS